MIMKTLIIAAAVILLGAPVALAASTSSRPSNAKAGSHTVVDTSLTSQCTMLSKQFDQAKAVHKTDKSYEDALALGTEGKTLCSTGNKQAAGVEYLHSAIRLIGIKATI